MFIILLVFTSCSKDNASSPISENGNIEFISAVDISSYPEIENSNPTFYDLEGQQNNFLNILKVNGVNTIRLRRLYVARQTLIAF